MPSWMEEGLKLTWGQTKSDANQQGKTNEAPILTRKTKIKALVSADVQKRDDVSFNCKLL